MLLGLRKAEFTFVRFFILFSMSDPVLGDKEIKHNATTFTLVLSCQVYIKATLKKISLLVSELNLFSLYLM
jgi:hypothetical protein